MIAKEDVKKAIRRLEEEMKGDGCTKAVGAAEA